MRKILALATLLTLSPLALAGVALPPLQHLPPPQPLPGEPLPTQPAALPAPSSGAALPAPSAMNEQALPPVSATTVPAISPVPEGQNAALYQSPAKAWSSLIAPPPEAPESASTVKATSAALSAAQRAKVTLPMLPGNEAVKVQTRTATIVTAPLHVSVVQFPSGFLPTIAAGLNAKEFVVQHALVGNIPELFLIPRFKGLHESMVVAGTLNGQAVNYNLELVSTATRYVPVTSFQESTPAIRKWPTALTVSGPGVAKAPKKVISPLNRMAPINIDNIDLHWKVSCAGGGWFSSSDCAPIRPTQVWSTKSHTYLRFKGLSNGLVPAVKVAFHGKYEQTNMTWKQDGRLLIVDTVPSKIILTHDNLETEVKHETN